MKHKNILPITLCLLLLTAIIAYPSLKASAGTTLLKSGPMGQLSINAAQACLPQYGEQEFLLQVNDTGSLEYEPHLTAADLNNDGLEDAIITKSTFQTYETYALDILLNDGQGGMLLATSTIFQGQVPAVQHPTRVITADFNGDDRLDIFVSDHGYDDNPFPGFQNQLALSTAGGYLVDATGNLPQQIDYTHSACAADIDGDDDIDLYTGNTWGQNPINPQILLNDGSGRFSIAKNRLPPLIDLSQNGFTTCTFADVDNDQALDLILGDAGDDIPNEHSTRRSVVLFNNGAGSFKNRSSSLPAKILSPHDKAEFIQPLYLNGDDHIDLLIAYEGWGEHDQVWLGSYIQALVNEGDGTFRDETAARIEPLNRKVGIPKLALRDLDRDQDLDLLALPWDFMDPNPILLLNDGRGHFAKKQLDFKITYLYYTFLDLHGDKGHDLLMATYAPPEDVFRIRDLGCPTFLPMVTYNH